MIALRLIERTVTSIKSVYSSNMGIDNLFVANVIDSAREAVLYDRSMKGQNKQIPSQLLQPYELYYDASLQPLNSDGSFTIYNLPRLAQVSAAITAPVTVMKLKGVAYPLYTSLQLYETMMRNSYINPKDDAVVLVNNGYADQLYLYGERKKELRVQAVFAAPMALETFNPYFDNYPIVSDMDAAIEAQIVSLYMRNLQAQAPRYVKQSGIK